MESTGDANWFYSARQERLSDWIRAQTCFEANSFEMVQHMVLRKNPEYLSSFSDTETSHTAHVVAMVLSNRYHQRGCPGPEEHCHITPTKEFLASSQEIFNDIKGYRSTRNCQ